jgi:hypothetical protein
MAKKPFSFAHLLGRGASASEEEEDKSQRRKPVALKKTSVTMTPKTMIRTMTRKLPTMTPDDDDDDSGRFRR